MNSTQIKNINRMNRASASPLLGQVVQDLITSASATSGTIFKIAGASGYHTVTSGEASANRVVIATGLASVTGFIAQSSRSGSSVVNANCVSGSVAGTLVFQTQTSGCATALAQNDIVSYMAW